MNEHNNQHYYVGIDLGGTDIKGALVTESGEILNQVQTPTLAHRGFESVVADMASLARKTYEDLNIPQTQILSIGIGIPGIADEKTGKVLYCANLNWIDVPLVAEMQKHLPLPVFVENDATVAGLAEHTLGVGKGTHSSVFVTLGTGVGSGIIINDRPWSGFHGIGGELGHAVLQLEDGESCGCGHTGCIERYCSATALINMGKKALQSNTNSQMIEKCNQNISALTAKDIIDSAKENDALALQVFNTYVRNLCKMIATITNIIDPEIIVLGGGVSKAGDFLLNAINAKVGEEKLFKMCAYPEIKLAKLSANAGVLGAAMLGKGIRR